MNALQIIEPGHIKIVSIEKPSIRPDEVLLKILRVGYCGSDLNTFRGGNPLVSYPRIPGHEIAARVEDKGGEVPESIRAGMLATVLPYTECERCAACISDRPNACKNNETLGVQREGALTEYIAVPWRKVLPSVKLSPAELALVEPLAVGFHAVARGRVEPTDTVVVLGSGMIGLGAIAGAGLRCGARVIAVDRDDEKLALARKAGASETINSRTTPLHDRLQELTQGNGPDVIIEAVGAPETFVAAVEEVKYSGRVVYVGYAKKPVSYETKYFLLKELDVMGSRGATIQDFRHVISLLESRQYPVEGTITRTVNLADAGAAMQAWAEDPLRITKIHISLE